MTKEWLWGPGRIASEHKGLPKREYLERLAAVRAAYLGKLLQHLESENIPYLCRMETARYAFLAELDQVTDDEFARPEPDVPACRDCPNQTTCEARKVCEGWSLADFAAHLLTHEEKNVAPEINETLQHMAEHEETHLHQVQSVVAALRRRRAATTSPSRP